MKVVIPVAGLGSRLKPHTFTTPKPLMQVAGKAIIDYVLEDVSTLNPSEVVLVVGYHKEKVVDYVLKKYSNLNFKFVEQSVMDGDGGAIRVGLDAIIGDSSLDEDLYVIFGADTLIDFNLKKELRKAKDLDAVIFGMRVDDPSHYGIINLDKKGRVISVEEKPENPKSNLAIIGAYYFKSAVRVKNLLDDFYRRNERVKDEFKLIQVLDNYISNKNLNVGTLEVSSWFDCGRREVLLEANKYFLTKNSTLDKITKKGDSIIIPPCYIAKSAKLEKCIVGPYVSVGDNAKLSNLVVKNSIVGSNSHVETFVLENSLIGRDAYLSGNANSLNLGDKSEINLK